MRVARRSTTFSLMACRRVGVVERTHQAEELTAFSAADAKDELPDASLKLSHTYGFNGKVRL